MQLSLLTYICSFIGSESDFPMDNQFLQVINAYMRPKCHSADSDAVHRYKGSP